MIALLALAAAAPASALPVGEWINPKHSVRVRARDCGGNLCGWVAWADGEATADAKEEGISPLVGVELLRSYRPVGPNKWQGRVFLPDWNRTFWSSITRIAPNQLKISGCLMGGFICKSQVWTAV